MIVNRHQILWPRTEARKDPDCKPSGHETAARSDSHFPARRYECGPRPKKTAQSSDPATRLILGIGTNPAQARWLVAWPHRFHGDGKLRSSAYPVARGAPAPYVRRRGARQSRHHPWDRSRSTLEIAAIEAVAQPPTAGSERAGLGFGVAARFGGRRCGGSWCLSRVGLAAWVRRRSVG
jgi:hypothetical protein